ncbi:MAG TPA: glycosyltransferase [Opitutaceae bacterium]|nr:glycosyltransferase [Opitutaceae bacterium]
MNILFVNYGDFTTNSLNHIAGFANALHARGHACAVAVPERKATISAIPQVHFQALLFDEALAQPTLFPDGKSADIIHAWTPRELVRKFVLRYQALAPQPARLIVHLEDNETHLLESFTKTPFAALREAPPEKIASLLLDSLPHPLRHQALLLAADGITHIVETLRSFIPPDIPHLLLPPGVDFTQYRPQRPDPELRRELGLGETEKVIAYTGSATFANEAEMRELYAAVRLLNERGVPTRLIRTGITPPEFLASLSAEDTAHVIHLGFVEKTKLPKLLALSDVLVQPGHPGRFNDFRLPSKLPEYFACGKPIILPQSNIGNEVVDGQDALLLQTGTPEEIADLCQRVFNDPKLAARLREFGVVFARAHFDQNVITDKLAAFYTSLAARAPGNAWTNLAITNGSEIGLLASRVLDSATTAAPQLRDELELLALLVRELESSLGETRQKQALGNLEKDLAYWKSQYDLTKAHLDNVERKLTLTKNHSDLLQVTLEAARADLNRAEQLRRDTEAQLREAHTRMHQLSVESLTLRSEIARLDDRVIQLGIHLRDVVYERDEKIRKIQTSFSWKATAWLRALRRLLIDHGRKQTSKPAPLPPPPEHTRSKYTSSFGQVSEPNETDQSFRYTIDYPHVTSFRPATLVVRGWCFASDGRKLLALRARVGDREYPAVAGLKRLDVLAALREYPQAEYCGFKADIELKLGDTELVLEASVEAGKFVEFFRREITVKEDGGVEELTSYQKWIETYDSLSTQQLAEQREQSQNFSYRPLISILVPVYNTPEKWLRKAVESVKSQSYTHWELCLANDASPAPHVAPLLDELASSDPRIKVVHRPKNGHISAASNSALELATGEFTALLDHDDEITPNALFEVVTALNHHPEVDLVYSDEDKIDEDGRRLEPYFKPDFLPDLYLGQNYTSHLSVYRTSVLRDLGGFRVGYEGSQDWDLALRVIDRIGEARIFHIPKILYHWRAIPGSTALLLSEKNYPVEAARRALADHFARKQQNVELVTVPGDHWRVKYALPKDPPRVALIIPTRNRVKLLKQCVESILAKTTYPNFEVIVVDNGSDEKETVTYLAELRARGLRVLAYDQPFNYSAINNFAVGHTDAELVGLLNNDLEVINGDWLDEMASQASRPEIGCVGAMLYYPNDRIQHAGVIVGMGGVAGHAFRDFPRGTPGYFNRARLVQNFSAVTAACLVVRRAIYDQVGGLDDKALAVAFNDVDFCLKVKAAGYRNLWTPFAELYHHESASRGAEDTPEKHERFRLEVETMLERWRHDIQHDPAYNPNLTLELNDFSLAAPPRPSVLHPTHAL